MESLVVEFEVSIRQLVAIIALILFIPNNNNGIFVGLQQVSEVLQTNAPSIKEIKEPINESTGHLAAACNQPHKYIV